MADAVASRHPVCLFHLFFFLAVVFIYARVGSAQLAQCVLCEGGLVLECVAIVAKGCAN